MIVPRSDFDPYGGKKRAQRGPENDKILLFQKKIEPNRSLSGVGQSRPGRAEVEGVKTDPRKARGGPSGTKNGHL